MIGKICFSFWKKKHCNYFFIDFIRENDISVLERGRDRIFRQFHVVYRYENTDRPSRNDVLLVWLRFMPDFGILTFLYVTNLLSSILLYIVLSIFGSIKVSQELSSNTRNFENIRGQYKYIYLPRI